MMVIPKGVVSVRRKVATPELGQGKAVAAPKGVVNVWSKVAHYLHI